MHTYTIRDLRNRTGELVRDSQQGEIAMVTKHGKPVFVAVPMSDRLLHYGVHEVVAVKLYQEGALSLSKAARLADQPVEKFIGALSAAGVAVVDYPAEDLAEELEHFS